MNVATALLVPFFAIILIFAALAVVRLGQGIRPQAGDQGADGLNMIDPEILALEEEKARHLATLQDLDQEFSLGKLSESDYVGLKRHVEHEVVRVMGRLDSLVYERDGEDA